MIYFPRLTAAALADGVGDGSGVWVHGGEARVLQVGAVAGDGVGGGGQGEDAADAEAGKEKKFVVMRNETGKMPHN